MAIQSTYTVRPDIGRPGVLSRPTQNPFIDPGVAYVPSSGVAPEPGFGVYYDKANNGFAVPTTSDQQELVCGIVTSPGNRIQENDGDVEFKNGDPIEIITVGDIWVTTEGAVEYGDTMQFDYTAKKWESLAIPSPGTSSASHTNWFNALQLVRVTVVSTSAKADELVSVRIGAGRIT